MQYRWLLRLWIGMVMGALALPVQAGSPESSVSYQIKQASGIRVHVVTADLRNPALMVRPVLAYNTPGRGQSFLSFLAQHQPLAQISGGYFSTSNWLPIGDIVIDGLLRYRGQVGSALAIRPDNTIEIVDVPRGWRYSWPGYEHVLRGGMRLIRHGEFSVYPNRQGFHDPGLFREASRTAVGILPGNRLLLAATGAAISLSKMASVMKALGCTEAMSLDGGTSTGLAYGSSIIIAPGRQLSSVLMILERPDPPAPPAEAITTTMPNTPTAPE